MKKRTTMLSEKIQEHLASRNMTQGELARRLDISNSYLSKMLSATNRMSGERVRQIAAILQLSTEQTAELIRLGQTEGDSVVHAESDGEAPLEPEENTLELVMQKATHLIMGIETMQRFLSEKKERIQHALTQLQEAVAYLQEEVASLDALLSVPELQPIQQAGSMSRGVGNHRVWLLWRCVRHREPMELQAANDRME